jgi:hypothetical protein
MGEMSFESYNDIPPNCASPVYMHVDNNDVPFQVSEYQQYQEASIDDDGDIYVNDRE